MQSGLILVANQRSEHVLHLVAISQTVFAIPDQVASWELASSRHAVHESSSCFSSKPKVENCLLKIMAASNGEALQSLKRTTGWNEFYREVAVSALILCFFTLHTYN